MIFNVVVGVVFVVVAVVVNVACIFFDAVVVDVACIFFDAVGVNDDVV